MLSNQPVLSQILKTALQKNELANAYLLVGENANVYPDEIVQFLTQETNRITNRNYRDYLVFDEASGLKKEDVKKLQIYFSKKTQEDFGKKIYTIYNVEKASNAALNALLKFLEEPVSDTIAILTCSNKDLVLPTIASRCQVITLKEETKAVSEVVVTLFEKYKVYDNLDLMFIEMHKDATSKEIDYAIFYEVYQLLIEYYRSRNLIYFKSFAKLQNHFEKSCSLALVLDATLYEIKRRLAQKNG